MDVRLTHSPDPLDRANEVAEQFLQDALAQQKAKSEQLPITGRCHACHQPGITGIFCDTECSELYEDLKRSGQV